MALVCIFISTLGAGIASTFDGGGASGYLEDIIRVRGCGYEKSSDVISFFHMDPKGRWTMDTDSGNYTGTYTELKSGKKFRLELDPSSFSDVIFDLEADSDRLCSLSPGSSSIINTVIETFYAKLNKKRTKINLMLKITGIRTDGIVTSNILYSSEGKVDFNPSGCRKKQSKTIKNKTTFAYPQAVDISDLNADGSPDITISEDKLQFKLKHKSGYGYKIQLKEGSHAALYLQDPFAQGVFLRQPNYTVSPMVKAKHGSRPQVLSVASGDLDGNSIQDIVVTHKGNDSVGVFLQDAGYPGQFMHVIHHPAGALPVDVAIGDLNGDGINDMAVAGVDLVLLLNDPIAPGSVFDELALGVANVSSVGISDINGDGRNDLAATSGDMVIVLLHDSLPAAPGLFTTRTSYVTGINAADVAIRDLNGDSLPDLAVANRGDTIGSVSVHMQDTLAVGAFLPGENYQTGVNSQSVVFDDLNGDYLPDLAVANNDSDGGSVSVLLHDAITQGVFLVADNYPGMYGPNDIATSDMDGDGLTDLVIADKCSRSTKQSYIRYQDINNPGNFLYPVYLP